MEYDISNGIANVMRVENTTTRLSSVKALPNLESFIMNGKYTSTRSTRIHIRAVQKYEEDAEKGITNLVTSGKFCTTVVERVFQDVDVVATTVLSLCCARSKPGFGVSFGQVRFAILWLFNFNSKVGVACKYRPYLKEARLPEEYSP